MIKLDLTGQTFGRLTVTGRSVNPDKNAKWWNCICSCGKAKAVRSISLRSGDTKSCGCINPQRLRPYEALYRRMERDNTQLRKLDFTLSYEDFVEFTKITKCFYCTATILWKDFSANGHGYNLDRKDNDRGYCKDNLVVCCKRCNMGKRDTFTFQEWNGMTAFFRQK